MPLHAKCVWLSGVGTRCKTAWFYRWFFGSMGNCCRIGRPLLLTNPQYMHLGDNVFIRPGARLEAIRPFSHRVPELRIGNNVNLEQNVHIICQSKIYIGDKVSITGNCAVVDTAHPFLGNAAGEKMGDKIQDEDSFIEIGEGAFIGYGSVILPNVRIGRYAVVGALTVVDKDVPDFGIVCGNPARLLRIYRAETSE